MQFHLVPLKEFQEANPKVNYKRLEWDTGKLEIAGETVEFLYRQYHGDYNEPLEAILYDLDEDETIVTMQSSYNMNSTYTTVEPGDKVNIIDLLESLHEDTRRYEFWSSKTGDTADSYVAEFENRFGPDVLGALEKLRRAHIVTGSARKLEQYFNAVKWVEENGIHGYNE